MYFVKQLPKIELHAHLNGCIRHSTLQEFLGTTPMVKVNQLDDAFALFSQIHSIDMTERRLRRIVREVLEDFQSDNVTYLELRTTPKHTKEYTQEGYIRIVLDEMQSFDKNMICRLLVSIDRARGLAYAEQTFTALQHPNPYLVGIDISGHPKAPFPLRAYNSIFQALKRMNLKITAHVGEIVESVDEIDEFLDQGIDRLGHLCYYRPDQIARIREQKLAVEICFSSNIATLQQKARDHHFIEIYRQAIPVIPCVDDTSLFNTTLTNEIEMLQNAFSLTNQELVEMQVKAIDHIFYQSSKADLLSRLDEFRMVVQ